jgi:FMN-dependent NADH-azoreductase
MWRIILSSSGEGGFELGGMNAAINHLDPHIVAASRLLGVSEHYVIRIAYQEFGDDRHQQSIQSAYTEIPGLVQQLTQNMDMQN